MEDVFSVPFILSCHEMFIHLNRIAWVSGVSRGKGERWKRKRDPSKISSPLTLRKALILRLEQNGVFCDCFASFQLAKTFILKLKCSAFIRNTSFTDSWKGRLKNWVFVLSVRILVPSGYWATYCTDRKRRLLLVTVRPGSSRCKHRISHVPNLIQVLNA